MLSISSAQLAVMAEAHKRRTEPVWIFKELKTLHGNLLSALDDDFIQDEITACLLRCDELGLTSSQDRLSFCFLDIVGFPGFKSIHNLDDIIDKCRDTAADAGSIMLELQRLAPTAFWVGLLEHCQPERERRGMTG
ncbi:MAG: hypothetical protein ACU836_09100 [Gammaproteobacteria bacterium]